MGGTHTQIGIEFQSTQYNSYIGNKDEYLFWFLSFF